MNKHYALAAAMLTATLGLPSIAKAVVSPGCLIIPGVSVGHARLGGDDDNAVAQFGYSDFSEGAMQHGIDIFKKHDGSLVVIAEEVNETNGGKNNLTRQIAVSASYYKTAQRIGPGSSLSIIERAYPHARPVAHRLKTAYVGHVALLDDQTQGIAFEFPITNGKLSQNARCSAVTIHAKGSAITALYLPIYQPSSNGAFTALRDWRSDGK